MKAPKKAKYNILLVLTGGTICSFAQNGAQVSDTKKAQTLIVQKFRQSDCIYRSEELVSFEAKSPLDVLSENMTVEHWNTLISALKSYDLASYDGVIILHGTDTLAYTSSLLSILLAGTPVPVITVSAQLPLYEAGTNGNANFKAATELIVNGIKPNVYSVYANGRADERVMYVHYAAHLLQCANHSNDFFSADMTPVSMENAVFEGKQSTRSEMLLASCPALSASVLKISPYVGLDYGCFSLDGIKAVLHGTYHSSTVAVDTVSDTPEGSRASILYLAKRLASAPSPIPLFIEPCDKDACYAYETTKKALERGIRPIKGLSTEMAYAKLLIGTAFGLEADELEAFVLDEINGEKLQ